MRKIAREQAGYQEIVLHWVQKKWLQARFSTPSATLLFVLASLATQLCAMDIRTCINMLAGEVNSYLSLAKVSKVNEDKASCDIELPDGTELPEARLRPLLSNQGALLFLPKTGSQVIVGFLSPAEAVVLGYSEVEKIQFQEGKNGGLVIADKIADKLNNLESQLNQLKQILNAWTPVPSDGGATLKGAITAWSAQNLVPTQSKELQNSKISH